MSYKLHNSNSLKSVQLNEDTNIIFELNKTNNNNILLNTLIYASQYGCPISFSLIRNFNSTDDEGFGAGTKLDFMYEIVSASGNEIKLRHPTGDEEIFLKSDITKQEDGETLYYYLSTTTTNYITKKSSGSITYLTYYAGSFVVLFEYKGVTPLRPLRFTRNKNKEKGWTTIYYNIYGKIEFLYNQATLQEFVEFEYSNNKYNKLVVSKKFNRTTKTKINEISLDYLNGRLVTIKEMLHENATPIRHTTFEYINNELVVKNEITTLSSIVTLTDDAISQIQKLDNVLNINYVDNYQTNLSVKDSVVEYHFDGFNNLSNIKDIGGTIKVKNFNSDGRKQLLSASSNLLSNIEQNYSEYIKHTQSTIEKSSSHSYTLSTYETCPAGTGVYHLSLNNSSTNAEYFKFKFTKSGGRHNVENIFLWYKMTN